MDKWRFFKGRVDFDRNVEKGIDMIYLLLMPILSTLIQFLIAGWFYIDVTNLWWISYIMNTGYCMYDCYKLKQARYSVDKFIMVSVLFVPLYIYKRMTLVKGNKWLFTAIWITVFVADLLIPNALWVKALEMSNPAMINAVKEDSFAQYTDIEIGELFEGTLDEYEWDTYMGMNRRILVKVSGRLEGEHFEVVFEVNMDSSFSISYMSWAGVRYSDDETHSVIEYLYEKVNE